ncbi:MAG: M3 family oligoendopeptidase [Candidatus Dormibacteraeota bacterium]|nr:M3 family oligoendopeptidase [Candidatus Dormibacteraeota bacterium]
MAQMTKATGAENIRWDLTELYASPTDPEIEATLQAGMEDAQAFEADFKGKVALLKPADFAAMMERREDLEDRVARPSIYASLLHTQDTASPAHGRLLARVEEAGAERGRHLVFFSLELADLTDEQVAPLYADPLASRYKHTVEEARKYRPHNLSEVEERLLTERSPVSTSAWVRLFEELSASIKPELRGQRIGLEQALAMLRDNDRAVRQEASKSVTEALREDIRTRAYILNVVLQDKAIDDRLRKYPTWISARNLANETSDDAVQALVEAVTGRYPMVARYYRVKKRLLGLDKLHEWDRYAPVMAASRELPWEEAKELVLGSYRRFSHRAGELVEEFFERPWIDAALGDHKRGGAFCMGATPRYHPFVMMNYTGKLNDALTLAHELGHGLHDRLASKQNIFDYHPPLTLAETASVFGETLTFDRIMAEEGDPRIRLSMLCDQVEGAFATVFRQVSMNRFEDAAHTRRRTEGELAPEQFGEIWQEVLQPMFGDSLELTENHKPWWSYVGHFYFAPGYVYAYAYGNLLALSVYQRYKESGPEFVDRYLDFLAAGGSTRPDELVRKLDMDITDPGFWDAGLSILDGMVTQIEELAASAGS